MRHCSDELKLNLFAGFSIKGKSHIRTKQPNQDRFLIRLLPYCEVFVVADGVGSHKFSQKGSKYICYAVQNAFKKLQKNAIVEDEILSTIYKGYKNQIRRKEKNNVGTTCLFAVIYNNKLYIGQAGDGVCCVKINGKFKMTAQKESDFTNEVLAISDKAEYNTWRYRCIDLGNINSLEIMLTTDGISEDIIPEKMPDFMSFVFSKVDNDRRNGLKKLLQNWSFPGSIDDKTILVARWKR